MDEPVESQLQSEGLEGLPHDKHIAKLYRRQRTLQNLFLTTTAALIVFMLSVAFFLLKASGLVRAQYFTQRAAATKMNSEFEVFEPKMRGFIQAMQQFALTNRDYQPIVEKYRPLLSNFWATPSGLPATKPGASKAGAPLR
jgi:hypothetical protein